MNLFKLMGSIFINNYKANRTIDDTIQKSKEMADKFGRHCKTVGDKFTNVGKVIAPVSAVVGTALGFSVKSASDFTDAMAKMSTLFDTQQTSVSELSDKFIELSNKTGVASTELAEAGYQALSAGVNVKDSVSFVETASNLARAGFTSTTTAVDVLTTAMNAYGEKAGTAEEISNKLVRTQNLGKTTVDELASSMGRVIPTASSMGINIDNLTSSYVSLTKQGISTAEATTYINSMFNELGDSGTKLGGIIKDKTGMSFQECMNSGMSLADVLQITKQYADENNIAYNELWGSAEAGKAGLAILNDGVQEFNSTVETMASKTDDVGEALKKLDTPSVKAKKSLNQIKNSGIELGESLLGSLNPVLEKVSGVVEKVTTWFNNLDDKTKTAISTFMLVTAVSAPVLMIFGKVASVVGNVAIKGSALIGKFQGIIASTGSLGGALSSLISPVTVVIGVIVALITAFVALYNNNEEFRNKVNNVWESVKEKISLIIQGIQEIINVFIDAFKQIWDAWGQDIINVVSTAFDFIASIVQTGLDIIHNIITIVTGLIKGDWSLVWEGLKSLVTSVWEGLKTIVQTGIDFIKSIVQLGLTMIKTTFEGIWNTIKSTVQNAIDGVKSFISSGLESAKSTVSGILESIKDKFNSIFESAKNIVKNAIDRIKGFFNFNWSLPDLKLPHFKISGEFSLNPPSVPSFGVEWYKKAMDEPYMFTKPTIFGVNPKTGSFRGAGESGDEIMIGRNTLMNMIKEATNEDSSESTVVKMLDTLIRWFIDGGFVNTLIDVLVEHVTLNLDNREVARLVKKYA